MTDMGGTSGSGELVSSWLVMSQLSSRRGSTSSVRRPHSAVTRGGHRAGLLRPGAGRAGCASRVTPAGLAGRVTPRADAAGRTASYRDLVRRSFTQWLRHPGPWAIDGAVAAVLLALMVSQLALTLVARGWSNAEVAERLYLSAATAKTHVGRLLMKLQARDRTQLVVIAYETGLVTPGAPPSR